MRDIKLSGREMAVIKAIDYTTGSLGTELAERTQLDHQDLLDVLTGLLDVGYIEAFAGDSQAPVLDLTAEKIGSTRFEVNPSYALQIRQAMKR